VTISLSSQGSRVLIGSPGGEDYTAQTEVLEFDEETNGWEPLGQTFIHDFSQISCPDVLSFSGEGNRFALGCSMNGKILQIFALKSVY